MVALHKDSFNLTVLINDVGHQQNLFRPLIGKKGNIHAVEVFHVTAFAFAFAFILYPEISQRPQADKGVKAE